MAITALLSGLSLRMVLFVLSTLSCSWLALRLDLHALDICLWVDWPTSKHSMTASQPMQQASRSCLTLQGSAEPRGLPLGSLFSLLRSPSADPSADRCLLVIDH